MGISPSRPAATEAVHRVTFKHRSDSSLLPTGTKLYGCWSRSLELRSCMNLGSGRGSMDDVYTVIDMAELAKAIDNSPVCECERMRPATWVKSCKVSAYAFFNKGTDHALSTA